MAAISREIKLKSINAPTFTPLLTRVGILVTEDTVRHSEFRVSEFSGREQRRRPERGPSVSERGGRRNERNRERERERAMKRDTAKTFID